MILKDYNAFYIYIYYEYIHIYYVYYINTHQPLWVILYFVLYLFYFAIICLYFYLYI